MILRIGQASKYNRGMAPSKTSLAFLFVDKKTIIVGVLVLVAAFILGIIIGYYSNGPGNGDQMVQQYVTDQFKMSQVCVMK